MIASVLIANRGEIARRIIRTAHRIGVRTVAVHSDADAHAAHVREADAVVRIGPAPAAESYLRAEAILEAARASGAEAIHPGYGFLSENAQFAEAVIAAGRIWIGPPPAAIRAMGLKDAAKKLMSEAGVPVTPGYFGDDLSDARLAKEAARIGWPVLIKAVAGGGGKGMRKVERAGDFAESLASARREAASAFGDDRVLIETYVASPRHLEVQVFGDAHGDVVHLFERDCSLQRRHQKIIEESPAPGMSGAVRERLCAAAVKAARAIAYQGAGTVEFIADASQGLSADRIWFMEMNTRLQVEHPVTEAVTGVDLVEWQFRVAAGERLPLGQDEVRLTGHAIEARLYAEDPAAQFLPCTGALQVFEMPSVVRADTAVEAGDPVTPFYDPMIGKLIVHADSRATAAARLAAACAATRVWPVRTNAWFLSRCLADDDFIAGRIETGFVETRLAALTADPVASPRAQAAAAVAGWAGVSLGEATDPWAGGLAGFRLNAQPHGVARLFCGATALDFTLAPLPDGSVRVAGLSGAHSVVFGAAGSLQVDGADYRVFATPDGGQVVFEAGAAFAFRSRSERQGAGEAGGDGVLRSPMPGRIVAIARMAGDVVSAGETLLTLEAMKMEHALKAPFDGKIVELRVAVGDQVAENSVLARLEASAPG